MMCEEIYAGWMLVRGWTWSVCVSDGRRHVYNLGIDFSTLLAFAHVS